MGAPHYQDIKTFNDEGYRKNIIIFVCVREIAQTLSEPPLKVYEKKNDNERSPVAADHLLQTLLDHPAPKQSQQSLIERVSTSLDVAGNAYIYKVRTPRGMPVQLKIMRPDMIKLHPDPAGEVTHYSFTVGSETFPIPPEDVIHITGSPDALDPFYGLSPIAVLSRIGDLDNASIDYLRAFFFNSASPAAALKFKSAVVGTDERARIKEIYRDTYGLKQGGWHDVLVLDGDVDWQSIGSDPRRLDLGHIFGESESRICATFGVPPILVAVKVGLDASTYSNYENARSSFYEETCMPKWKRISDQLTADLAKEFGERLCIDFDLSEVRGLQESEDEIADRAIKQYTAGLITRGEAREMMNRESIEGVDDVYKSAYSDVFIGKDEDATGANQEEVIAKEEEAYGSSKVLAKRKKTNGKTDWKGLQ